MRAFYNLKLPVILVVGLVATNLVGEEVDLNLPQGFKAYRIYSVPVETQGSWKCLTFDKKDRLIASSKYGGMFRLTLPPVNVDLASQIEALDVNIGAAQGMLWAFDSLYIVVRAARKLHLGSCIFDRA